MTKNKIKFSKWDKVLLTLVMILLIVVIALSTNIFREKTKCVEDVYNCDDFKTHLEAQFVYEICGAN